MATRKPKVGDPVLYRCEGGGPSRVVVGLEEHQAVVDGKIVTRTAVVTEGTERVQKIRRGKDDVGAILENGTIRVRTLGEGAEAVALLADSEVATIIAGEEVPGLVVLDPAPRFRTTFRLQDLQWDEKAEAWFVPGLRHAKKGG